MGFPVGCTELAIPKLLVYLILSLAALRRVVVRMFHLLGLDDLLDAPLQAEHPAQISEIPVPRLPLTPARLHVLLPAEPYAEENRGESCAVCLHEFEKGEEVRRLRECRHVFHRGCLDPWVELGRRTCPLCRTPLLAGEEEPWICDDLHDYDADFEMFPIGGGDGGFSFFIAEELLSSASLRSR